MSSVSGGCLGRWLRRRPRRRRGFGRQAQRVRTGQQLDPFVEQQTGHGRIGRGVGRGVPDQVRGGPRATPGREGAADPEVRLAGRILCRAQPFDPSGPGPGQHQRLVQGPDHRPHRRVAPEPVLHVGAGHLGPAGRRRSAERGQQRHVRTQHLCERRPCPGEPTVGPARSGRLGGKGGERRRAGVRGDQRVGRELRQPTLQIGDLDGLPAGALRQVRGQQRLCGGQQGTDPDRPAAQTGPAQAGEGDRGVRRRALGVQDRATQPGLLAAARFQHRAQCAQPEPVGGDVERQAAALLVGPALLVAARLRPGPAQHAGQTPARRRSEQVRDPRLHRRLQRGDRVGRPTGRPGRYGRQDRGHSLGHCAGPARCAQHVESVRHVLAAAQGVGGQPRTDRVPSDQLVDALGQHQVAHRVQRVGEVVQQRFHRSPVGLRHHRRAVDDAGQVGRAGTRTHQGHPVDDIARGDGLRAARPQLRVGLLPFGVGHDREGELAPEPFDEVVQLRIVQCPLEPVTQQGAQVLTLAYAAEQQAGDPGATGGEADRVGLLAGVAEEARAQHGRGCRVLQRRCVDVAVLPGHLGRGGLVVHLDLDLLPRHRRPQLLHPAVAAVPDPAGPGCPQLGQPPRRQ
ncbi:UNVERIFIED_CONTAM: hypothetical protein RKD43_005810 [Streptomyces graminofaciens]